MFDKQEFVSKLVTEEKAKIVLLVMDGLGDIPVNGKTPFRLQTLQIWTVWQKKVILGRRYPFFPESPRAVDQDIFHCSDTIP